MRMTLPIRSRHGLTRCRACRAHIQTGPTPSRTVCPFCGVHQRGEPKARPRIVAVGRGSILAAGLLAFTACAEPPAPAPSPSPDPILQPSPAPQPPMQPLRPDDPVVVADPLPEPEPPEPEPEVDEPSDTIVQRPRPRPPAPNPAPMPAYGVAPPPDAWAPQRPDHMRPTPRYGLPPMRDRVPSPPPSNQNDQG